MIHNAKLVVPALAIFIALLTYPLWQSGIKQQPHPQAPNQGQCVESAAWMRANHMKLLDDWRHSVVRDQERTYVNSQGQSFDKSLTKTCLHCHANKKEFCDQCHQYAGVKLVCFECHINPELIPHEPAEEAR